MSSVLHGTKKTGLQHASEKGHVDVVKWLLEHEAKLKENVWEEDSEFYMATLNGNQDVIDVLITRMPSTYHFVSK